MVNDGSNNQCHGAKSDVLPPSLPSDENPGMPPPPPSSPRTMSKDISPMSSPGTTEMPSPLSGMRATDHRFFPFRSRSTSIACATSGSSTEYSPELINLNASITASPTSPTSLGTSDSQEHPMPLQPCDNSAERAMLYKNLVYNRTLRIDLDAPEKASICSTQVDPSSPRRSWTFSQTSTATSSPNSSFGRTSGKRMRHIFAAQEHFSSGLSSPTAFVGGVHEISGPIPVLVSLPKQPQSQDPKSNSLQASRTSWYQTPSRKRIISPPVPLRPPPPSQASFEEERRIPCLAPYHRAPPKPPTKKPSGNSLSSKKHGPTRKKSLQFLDSLPSFMEFDSEGEEGCGLTRLWSERGARTDGQDLKGKGGGTRGRETKGAVEARHDKNDGREMTDKRQISIRDRLLGVKRSKRRRSHAESPQRESSSAIRATSRNTAREINLAET